MQGYELLDSGSGRKLERFGPYIINRPCAQAIWKAQLPETKWQQADAYFKRITDKKGHWKFNKPIPESWNIQIDQSFFKISPTPFGHLGIFPEQISQWQWLSQQIQTPCKILNLFAYSGGSTLACSLAGAQSTHLDASRPMIGWAKENAKLSRIPEKNIIWVLDDAQKFLQREINRKRKYDGLILDPPSFGRGPKKEIFKFEKDLMSLLEASAQLLSSDPKFFLLSCHTPGITANILKNILKHLFEYGKISCGEMMALGKKDINPLPSGVYARWHP